MKKIVLSFAVMLLTLVMPMACSSDDVEEKGLTEEEMLNQTTELYPSTLSNKLEKRSETIGDWQIQRLNDGTIVEANFRNSKNPPESAERFFKEYLPLTKDNILVLFRSDTSYGIVQETYTQRYKGMYVPTSCRCSYSDDGKTLVSLTGDFMPIDDLDVNPKISTDLATRIGEAYFLKKAPNDHKGGAELMEPQLKIYVKDGKRYVHLVYTLNRGLGDNAWDYCDIDAHSGRILFYGLVLIG